MLEPTRRSDLSYEVLDRWNRTIADVFAESAAAHPSLLYVSDGERRVDRAAMALAVEACRSALAAAGVARGDVVSLQLSNTWTTVAAMHAVWALGAIVNPITPIYRGSELETIFRSAEPSAVIVSAAARGVDFVTQAKSALAAVGSEAPVLAVESLVPGAATPASDADTNGSDADADGSDVPPRRASDEQAATGHDDDGPASRPGDVALLMFTSGTTGTPKGVLHSHQTLLYEAASIGAVFGLEGDAIFMPSSLAHVTGLLYGVVMPLLVGGSVSLLDRWDAEAAVDIIERDRCTFTVSATPFLRGLADCYARRGTHSSLRAFVCGGADIPATLVAGAERAMGMHVARTYGSTEMPTLCIVRPDDASEARVDSEGQPIGEAAARLSEEGELEVRGPELFVGYLDERDNASAFTADGWFRTGDLARLGADGSVTITGRLKDLIVRGGENISAKEVEDLLLTHPAIDDVALIGVPDPLMGERACAVVVPAAGAVVRLSDLTAHLDQQAIARQKYPELLLTVDSFPRTVSGKIQKFVLRQQAIAAAASGRLETRA
jgi:cyclohexanecarboxylate-CoA ligase